MSLLGCIRAVSQQAKQRQQVLLLHTVADAAQAADFIMILLPDEAKTVYKQIEPHLTEGKVLAFAHGFNIHFGQVVPQ